MAGGLLWLVISTTALTILTARLDQATGAQPEQTSRYRAPHDK